MRRAETGRGSLMVQAVGGRWVQVPLIQSSRDTLLRPRRFLAPKRELTHSGTAVMCRAGGKDAGDSSSQLFTRCVP
eukprot:11880-Eustigmatos_ZCMA.PRE.1